jgi:hypothetical protein
MTWEAHLLLVVTVASCIAFIVRLVRRGQLRAKYSMLWLSIGLVLVVIAAFPRVLGHLAELAGVQYAPVAFLLVAMAFLLVVAVHFSWELSRLEERTRTLAERLALLEQRLDERTQTAP